MTSTEGRMTPDLDALEKKARFATPGPWVRWAGHAEVYAGQPTTNNRGMLCGTKGEICRCDDLEFGERQAVRNANFIVAANPAAILALIARVRAAEAALGEAREVVDGIAADAESAGNDALGKAPSEALLMWAINNRARAWLAQNPRKESV